MPVVVTAAGSGKLEFSPPCHAQAAWSQRPSLPWPDDSPEWSSSWAWFRSDLGLKRYCVSAGFLDHHYQYDTKTMTWERLVVSDDLQSPPPRGHFGMAAWVHTLYIFGGAAPDGEEPQKSLSGKRRGLFQCNMLRVQGCCSGNTSVSRLLSLISPVCTVAQVRRSRCILCVVCRLFKCSPQLRSMFRFMGGLESWFARPPAIASMGNGYGGMGRWPICFRWEQ